MARMRIVPFLLVGLLLVTPAFAQTLVLTRGTLYDAGPDYATDVLQDEWDFVNGEDVAPDPDQTGGFSFPPPETVRLNGTGAYVDPAGGGWFRGVPVSDPGITLLYRPDAHGLNPGRTGERFPIDPARYRKLAIKMRVTGLASPSQLVAYWFHSEIGEPNAVNRAGGAVLPPNTPVGTSTIVYVLDLATVGNPLPVGSTAALYATAGEVVKGFRIDPVFGSAGGVEIDWVRLTASNNQAHAALMPASISGCSDLQSFTVTDAAGVATVITDFTGSAASASFNYGIFPPGAYNVRATCGNGTTPDVPISINTPPVVTVIDPDETGDPATDYALLNRGGDRWDFEQLTDVARSFNVTTSGGACAATGPCGIVPTELPGATGNMLRASSVNAVGDPGLEMLNGVIVPLNSRKHRILTFSLRNRRPYLLNAVVGPVLRVLWGSEATGANMTASQDLRVWPGFNRYTVDLGALTAANGGIETECQGCPTIPWMSRAIHHLRIDPHEYGDVPTTFDLDDMTVTAPDTVIVGGQFTVRYTFSDADVAGATYRARIYRESWPDRTNRVEMATIPGVAPGVVLTYAFNTAGLPAGEHTISVEIDEVRAGFTQTSRAYATGALVVSNPAASSPHITVSTPTPNQNVPVPFTIQGCAYDDGVATGDINVDDLTVRMRGVAGPRAGTVLALGYDYAYPGTGALQFGPFGTPVACPAASGVYAQSGFRVLNIGAGSGDYFHGSWLLDVFARSTISGELIQLAEIPIQIGPVAPQGPTNFQATANGNTVTVSWQAPGPGVAYYQIQGATNPAFAPVAFQVDLPGTGPYSGDLASGTYYLRVYARSTAGVWSAPSATRIVNVALPQPPGTPALVASQVAANPVTLNWSAGPGGTPTSFTVIASTTPGGSDLAVAPMGLATTVTAVAPVGVPIFVRVVAANAAGQATSNEVSFNLSPPAAPVLNPATVVNRVVTLTWTPVANATAYTLLARFPGSPAVIAALPVGSDTVTVPAPPGAYVVTVVATNTQGTSAESNPITVVVP